MTRLKSVPPVRIIEFLQVLERKMGTHHGHHARIPLFGRKKYKSYFFRKLLTTKLNKNNGRSLTSGRLGEIGEDVFCIVDLFARFQENLLGKYSNKSFLGM